MQTLKKRCIRQRKICILTPSLPFLPFHHLLEILLCSEIAPRKHLSTPPYKFPYKLRPFRVLGYYYSMCPVFWGHQKLTELYGERVRKKFHILDVKYWNTTIYKCNRYIYICCCCFLSPIFLTLTKELRLCTSYMTSAPPLYRLRYSFLNVLERVREKRSI